MALSTTGGKLSQFSPTTSTELAGVISDETGTGSLVFSASPTLTGTLTSADVYASGKLLVGSSTSIPTQYSGAAYTPGVQTQSTSFANSSSLNALFSATTNPPAHFFAKSRGSTVGTYTSVATSDVLGALSFAGADGTSLIEGARIQSVTLGTVTTGVVSSTIDLMTAGRATSSISTISRVNATSIVTVTTSAVHYLKVGDSIVISGVADTSFNGSFTVRSITGITVFTLTQAGVDASSTGGTIVPSTNLPVTNLRVAPEGYVSIGSNATSLGRRLNVTGATTASTIGYGVYVGATAVPDNNSFVGYGTSLLTSANGGVGYTIANLYHFSAAALTPDADTTITAQYGFSSGSTLTQATTNFAFHAANTAAVTTGKTVHGFYSNINTATGGGTAWNFFANGTANNYFGGNVGITNTSPTVKLLVDRLSNSTQPASYTTGTTAAFIGSATTTSPSYVSIIAGNASASSVFFGDTDADSRGRVHYDHTTDALSLWSANTQQLTVDSVGTLGLGVVPSTWDGNWKALHFSGNTSLSSVTSGDTIRLSSNLYINGGSAKYVVSDRAITLYTLGNGIHSWGNAPALASSAGTSATLTTRMYLDASGSLGLGVTPSTSSVKMLQIAGGGVIAGAGGSVSLASNTYYNSAWKYTTAATAAYYQQTGNAHYWYSSTDATPVLNGNVTFAQAMTLDASGNLGLGVTPSAWGSTFRALQIARSSLFTPASGGSTYLDTNAYFDSVGYKYIANGFATEYAQVTDGSHRWYTAPSGTAGNAISFGDPKMALDASGNLSIVGSVTAPSGVLAKSGSNGYVKLTTGGASNTGYIEFFSAGVVRQGYIGFSSTTAAQDAGTIPYYAATHAFTGAITASGNITAYSSDSRLKTNVVAIPNALQKIQQIGGYSFDWDLETCESAGFKPEQQHEHGVLAQEIQRVLPDVVVPAAFNKDYLTVRYDRIVPLLIEAVKELDAKQSVIDSLEERISRLEALLNK